MAKSKQPAKNFNTRIIIVFAALLVLSLAWIVYDKTTDTSSLSTKSKLAYVDGAEATQQVSNFYRQYLANADKPDDQKKLIAKYGNQNLEFYNEYYQHGFDPITCSRMAPTKVTTSLSSTGTNAVVKVLASYPDHTISTLMARVVLSDEMEIDSITCPSPIGNLPPKA